MVKTPAMIALLLLAGCAASTRTPAPIADPKAIWCAENEPQRPSSAEIAVMQRDRLLATLTHNRKGEAWCGWKP